MSRFFKERFPKGYTMYQELYGDHTSCAFRTAPYSEYLGDKKSPFFWGRNIGDFALCVKGNAYAL